jgi:hypothetical protein
MDIHQAGPARLAGPPGHPSDETSSVRAEANEATVASARGHFRRHGRQADHARGVIAAARRDGLPA